MPLKSIGHVINHLMIYPLIVSFIVIAATISFSLFAVDNRRVEKIKSQSFDFHKFNLRDIGNTLGSAFQDYIEDIINDVSEFNTVMQSAYNSTISLNSTITPSSTPSYYVNALTFALEGYENIGIDIPGYDSENNFSVYRPMWFIDRDSIDITALPNFQESYENFIMVLPVMYSLYTSGKYTTIYSVTRERATTQRKLYSTYPLNQDFDSFMRTLRLGPWFNLATAIFNQGMQVALLDPYYIKNNGYVYTSCMSISLPSTYYADTDVNCLNYDMQLLLDSLQTVEGADGLDFFVMNSNNFNVIIHSNLQNVTTDQGTVNITQAQYGASATSSPDAVDFTSKLISLSGSLSSTNYYMEFTQDGIVNVLVLIQTSISVGTGQSLPYLIGVTQPKSFIYNYYSSFGDDVVKHARIQLIGVVSIFIALSAVYFLIGHNIDKSVTNSIKELIKFGKNIDAYFHTESKDFVSNKEQTQVSISASNNQKNKNFASSRELQLIHENFAQVMDMIHCTKEAQYASSDAEALTGYSQALKIYEKINHAKGLSIVYSNIARLHHQNGRIGEAMVNYQKAIVMIKQEINKLEKVSNDLKLEQHTHIKKGGFLRRKATLTPEEENQIETTKNSLDQMQRDMKVELAERFYEFGQCLIQFGKRSKGASKKTTLDQIKAVFSEVMKYDKGHRDKPYRIIICLLTISSVQLEQNDLTSAVEKLDEAELILDDYAKEYDRKSKESPSSYFIPPGILTQNLMLQRALYYRRLGLVQEAFKMLTDTLEIDIRFDPNIRKRCLLEMKSILKEADMLEMTPNLAKLLESYQSKVKDIVVVLDCSQSMGQGTRLRLLIKNVLNLFDNYLGSGDRMGYITFNLNCDTVFALTDKKKNTSQIRKLLEVMPRPSGGTALYTAIFEAIKLLCKAEPRDSSKWIVVLTDGDDDGDSRITHTQIVRRLGRSDANLVIMGLALPQSVARKMNDLCRATGGGVYVDSQTEDKLDEAFSMIISIIYGQEFKSEEITFQL